MTSWTIDIPDQDAEAVRRQAAAQGLTAEQWLVRLVAENSPAPEVPATVDLSPVSASIRDLWKDLSDEERAEYPEGGAYQIDHHVYGLPKR
jgi:hypothetical protein